MSREFVASSSEYLLASSFTGISTFPLSMACWWYPTDVSTQSEFHGLCDASSGQNFYYLGSRSDGSNFRLRFRSFTTYTWGGVLAVDTWVHACVTIDAGGDAGAVTLYTDGANAQTGNEGGVDETAFDRVGIGMLRDSSPSNAADGRVAEAAIWDVELTAAEAAMLGAGYSPLLVRPQSLVFYAPLIRDADRDIVGGYALSVGGTPTVAEHSRVLRYSPSAYVIESEAGTATISGASADGVSLSETATAAETMYPAGSDGATLADTPEAAFTHYAQSSDGTTLTDTPEAAARYPATSADGVELTDASATIARFFPASTDGVTLADSAAIAVTLYAETADGATLTDTVTVTVPGVLTGTVTDGVTLADSPTVRLTAFAEITDGAVFADLSEYGAYLSGTVTDGITLTDSAAVKATLSAVAADGIEFADLVSVLSHLLAATVDGVELADVTVAAGVEASGLMTMTASAKDASITVSAKLATISATARRRATT